MICHFLPVLLLSFSALATKEGKQPYSEVVLSELDNAIASTKEHLKALTIVRQNIADIGVLDFDKNAYMKQEAESIIQDDEFIIEHSKKLLGEASKLLPQAYSLLHKILHTDLKFDRDDIEKFYSDDRSNTPGVDYDSKSLLQ